jgi:myosin heavy subunit
MTINHQNNRFFFKKRTDPNVFGIKHYAGDVDYDVGGMMDKNRDTLFPDLENLMRDSKCGFIACLFSKNQAAAAPPAATATPTSSSPTGPVSSGAKWAATQMASSPPAGSSTLQRGGVASGARAGDWSASNGAMGNSTIKRGPGAMSAPASAAMSPTLKREVKTGGRATVSAQFREQLTHLSNLLSTTTVRLAVCPFSFR